MAFLKKQSFSWYLALVASCALTLFHFKLTQKKSFYTGPAYEKTKELSLIGENAFYYSLFKKLYFKQSIEQDDSHTFPHKVHLIKKYPLLGERIASSFLKKSYTPLAAHATLNLIFYGIGFFLILMMLFYQTKSILSLIIFYFFYFINFTFLSRIIENPFLKEHLGYSLFLGVFFSLYFYLKSHQNKFLYSFLTFLIALLLSWEIAHGLLFVLLIPLFYLFLKKEITRETFLKILLSGIVAYTISFLLNYLTFKMFFNIGFITLLTGIILTLKIRDSRILSTLFFLILSSSLFYLKKDQFITLPLFYELNPLLGPMSIRIFLLLTQSLIIPLILINLFRLFFHKIQLNQTKSFLYFVSYTLFFISLFKQHYLILSLPLMLMITLSDFFTFFPKKKYRWPSLLILAVIALFFNHEKLLKFTSKSVKPIFNKEVQVMIDYLKSSKQNVIAADMSLSVTLTLLGAGKTILNTDHQDKVNQKKITNFYKVYGHIHQKDFYELSKDFESTHIIINKQKCAFAHQQGQSFTEVIDQNIARKSRHLFCLNDFKRSRYFRSIFETNNYLILERSSIKISK